MTRPPRRVPQHEPAPAAAALRGTAGATFPCPILALSSTPWGSPIAPFRRVQRVLAENTFLEFQIGTRVTCGFQAAMGMRAGEFAGRKVPKCGSSAGVHQLFFVPCWKRVSRCVRTAAGAG